MIILLILIIGLPGPLYVVIESWLLSLGIGIIGLGLLVGFIAGWYESRHVRNDTYKEFDMERDQVVDRFTTMLSEADIHFQLRGGIDNHTTNDDESAFVLILEGDMKITIITNDELRVFVGPVYNETRQQVEALKDLIDNALK